MPEETVRKERTIPISIEIVALHAYWDSVLGSYVSPHRAAFDADAREGLAGLAVNEVSAKVVGPQSRVRIAPGVAPCYACAPLLGLIVDDQEGAACDPVLKMSLLNQEYKDLYSGYYRKDSALEHKRNLSAESTVEHIRSVANNARWRVVLDVGAGNGSVLSGLEKADLADELHAVEISESGVEAISKLGLERLKQATVFDGYHIPYPDGFFDLAICIHVLEHVEHERILLRELARVAKEVILEVPLEGGFNISKSIRQTAKYGHINHYTPRGFLFLLETAGLQPVQDLITTSSSAYERHLYGQVRGTIKNAIRRGLLRIAPRLASLFLVYLFTVRCGRRQQPPAAAA